MKKKPLIKSLLLKNIVYILLCSTLFLLAVTPFVEQTAFHMLQPLLAEYTTLSVNKAATRMSNFLALSNTALRVRIRTSDFQDALFRYIHFDSSEKEFQNDIQAALKPLETSFSMDENHDFLLSAIRLFILKKKDCSVALPFNTQQKHSSKKTGFRIISKNIPAILLILFFRLQSQMQTVNAISVSCLHEQQVTHHRRNITLSFLQNSRTSKNSGKICCTSE